jgi:hypothetical protein
VRIIVGYAKHRMVEYCDPMGDMFILEDTTSLTDIAAKRYAKMELEEHGYRITSKDLDVYEFEQICPTCHGDSYDEVTKAYCPSCNGTMVRHA